MRNLVKTFLLLIAFLFFSSLTSASCNSTQININVASLEELDKIIWVGPSTADKIISYRQENPFDSVDELLNVSGIGEAKISDIKSQGLACVNEENSYNQDQNQEDDNSSFQEQIINETNTLNQSYEQEETQIEDNKSYNNIKDIENKERSDGNLQPRLITSDIIKLVPKNIKTEQNKGILEKIDKKNFALYSLIGFCILLGFLFLAKKKRYENEFR